jgi:hypothetical protein
MATINQMTKTFQVVLNYFGLPENFGCRLMVATLMIENWFSLPEKIRAETKIWVAITKFNRWINGHC